MRTIGSTFGSLPPPVAIVIASWRAALLPVPWDFMASRAGPNMLPNAPPNMFPTKSSKEGSSSDGSGGSGTLTGAS